MPAKPAAAQAGKAAAAKPTGTKSATRAKGAAAALAAAKAAKAKPATKSATRAKSAAKTAAPEHSAGILVDAALEHSGIARAQQRQATKSERSATAARASGRPVPTPSTPPSEKGAAAEAAPAASVSVVLVGPCSKSETFRVHAPGCSDIARDATEQHGDAWPVETVNSLRDVARLVYGPDAGSFYEESGGDATWGERGGLDAYLDSCTAEFSVAPCVKGLLATPDGKSRASLARARARKGLRTPGLSTPQLAQIAASGPSPADVATAVEHIKRELESPQLAAVIASMSDHRYDEVDIDAAARAERSS